MPDTAPSMPIQPAPEEAKAPIARPTAGFMLSHPGLPLGGPRAFGHGGWGGSLGIADPDARLSWAYVMNKMSPGTTGDTRAFALAQALYACL